LLVLRCVVGGCYVFFATEDTESTEIKTQRKDLKKKKKKKMIWAFCLDCWVRLGLLVLLIFSRKGAKGQRRRGKKKKTGKDNLRFEI
jgi:hypothetical protein